MIKKVLMVSGSLRKGVSSEALCGQFVKGVVNEKHAWDIGEIVNQTSMKVANEFGRIIKIYE